MGLQGTFNINTNLSNSKDNVDLSTPSETVNQRTSKTISSGSMYHDTISLSANEIKILDVSDSSLSDVYGQTLALTGVTGLYFKAGDSNTSDVVLSGASASMINTQPALGASESIGFLTDIDVTSNDKIYIVNGAIAGLLDVIITGD